MSCYEQQGEQLLKVNHHKVGETGMEKTCRPKFNKLLKTVLLPGLLCMNAGAVAQEGIARLDIEEIVVTGTKRDIAQQDLAISVTTITSKQLENTFQHDVTALSEFAPNVNLTPQNGFNAWEIR